MRVFHRCCLALTALLALPGMARAAPGDWVKQVQPIAIPADGKGIALPVTLPSPKGAETRHEAWAQQGPGQRLVYNVNRPELIVVPPAPGVAPTGDQPAVILVPGGGFEFLSMDNEGYGVAERLGKLGVRVFILKYRTLILPDSIDGFRDALASTFAGKGPPIDILQDLPYAVADAQSALRTVRARAQEWHVDPRRVGLLGFSAGAMTTLAMMQANATDARPDFAGLIYGPTKTGPVPPHAPPLFAALAMDDRFFGKDDLGLIDGWRKSGASVEFHLYSGGGHGFASQPNGTTSDAWFAQYALWLKAMKIVP